MRVKRLLVLMFVELSNLWQNSWRKQDTDVQKSLDQNCFSAFIIICFSLYLFDGLSTQFSLKKRLYFDDCILKIDKDLKRGVYRKYFCLI